MFPAQIFSIRFFVCICGKQKKTEKVRRTEASSALPRRGTNLIVQCLMGYKRPMKSILQGSSRDVYYTCPRHTDQMPSVLVLLLPHFLFDYPLPSFPSLGILIWTWNFLGNPGKVRGIPRRRSNGSACPAGMSWTVESKLVVYVPAF